MVEDRLLERALEVAADRLMVEEFDPKELAYLALEVLAEEERAPMDGPEKDKVLRRLVQLAG